MSVLLVGSSPEKITYCKCHSHPNWEIVIPIYGTGWVETPNGEKFNFNTSSVYCIPPGTEHITHSPDGLLDIYIHTDALMLKTNTITILQGNESFKELGVLLLSAYLKKDEGWQGTMNATMELIVQLIYDILAESRGNSLAIRIRDYLLDNISNNEISSESIAQHFGYNSDYLRRIFKEKYSTTPLEYLGEQRFICAKKWLKNMPHYSVEEIASICGFSDRFYFSRFFKKREGISPSEYKNIK